MKWKLHLRWTHHLAIVTIRDNKDGMRVLVYSYYTSIVGWEVLLRAIPQFDFTVRNIENQLKKQMENAVKTRGSEVCVGLTCWL